MKATIQNDNNNNNPTTSYLNRKRPSPLRHSPGSTSSSSSSASSSSSTRRRINSPTSAAIAARATTAASTTSSSSSSGQPANTLYGPALTRQSQHHVGFGMEQQMQQHQSEANRRKQAALESQLNSLYELEYRQDVIQYMYDLESTTMASVELIDMQPELQWYMRPYLVDFLIEIHQQYRLRPETLYLALNIVDRYVSKRIVYKKHYQLVGCAALWIASKFEDAKDRVPTVEDLCAVCCSAYDQSAFIQMEGHVLSTINWSLGHPTAEAWLRIACAEGPQSAMEPKQTQDVTRFIMEITLFHRAFVSVKPSDVALACLLLARYMTQPQQPIKEQQSREVVKIAQMLDQHLAEHLEQVSSTVVKKYSPSFYSRASVYVREWYLSGRRFSLSSTDGVSAPAHASASTSIEVDMVTSSPSSSNSSQNGDSDFDEDEEDYSSVPITPTTSVGSMSSDPFEQVQLKPVVPQRPPYLRSQTRQRQEDAAMKDIQQEQQRTSQAAPATMQWQMHVVSPQDTASYSTYSS